MNLFELQSLNLFKAPVSEFGGNRSLNAQIRAHLRLNEQKTLNQKRELKSIQKGQK